ncbi:MAG TPA: PD-(D/E)XK nuclease family protein [Candidatus Paceibacterota bacterium]|nr:PD-(D/E)XK nuclease family protein [Candidatus Paceibacterota bacterium]
MRISYSSLENFKQCPLKYKLSNIDKIKEPKSKEAIFGTYIHKVLKWFYQKDPNFPTLDVLLKYYRDYWPQKTEGFEWKDSEEEKSYFKEGIRILEEFYNKNIPHKTSILDLETRFEVVLDEHPDKPNGKHILTGVIDRIDKLPDGTLEIIDYKTGKRMPSQKALDKNNQLSLYAIGLKSRWPRIKMEDLKLSLYFLKFNEKINTKRTDKDLEEAKNKIIDLIHKIEKSDFEPHSSFLCGWCGYRNICPIWRHFYENEEDKHLNDVDIKKSIDKYFDLKGRKEKLEEKLIELKNLIDVYCQQKGLKRVFGENGYFSHAVYNKISYDIPKLKEILEPLEKWDDVIEINTKKLKKILKEIPVDIRQKIKEIEKIDEEFKCLSINHTSKKEIEEELE